MRGNLIVGLLLLIFSVVFWLGADAIPKSRLSGSVGADGLPKMLAIALGVLSAGLIAQTLLMMRTVSAAASVSREKKREELSLYLRGFGMVAIGAAYLALVSYLGYMLTIALLLLTVAIYNGKRPTVGALLFAVVGSVFFYLLFVQVLEVPLPAGFWPRLIG
ncbi:tripartite tricarboxylate transporter TctB family protein [Microvirga pakistanensis]|uniref:tripartite tricarboxylate transporter TctB family protein n=1 Tax=Microvirga pakistanensis TaxID=1682650 RepID=UPI001068D5A9|nr:tripartite tricarboxylate transporter TctB family protein [Microvirga pakistanensis]